MEKGLDYFSYENILSRALQSIPDTFDKRQGSVIYNAIAPCCYELALAHIKLEMVSSKFDIENLEGEELKQYVYQRTGVEAKEAIKSSTFVIVTGTPGAKIEVGDLVSTADLSFTATESKIIGPVGEVSVAVTCEIPGSIGNVPKNSIVYFPLSITGLTAVTNPEAVTNGYDGDTDDAIRNNYYTRVRTPGTSGNKYHYKIWAEEVLGVGYARVFPLRNGPGTVKIIIVDSNKNIPSEELISTVSEYIETKRPIGATVSVEGVVSKNIAVYAKVKIIDGYTIQFVLDDFKVELEKYRQNTIIEDSYISYAAIANMLFKIEGVLDYSDFKLDNDIKNVSIGDEEIPMFTDIVLEVM